MSRLFDVLRAGADIRIHYDVQQGIVASAERVNALGRTEKVISGVAADVDSALDHLEDSLGSGEAKKLIKEWREEQDR